MLLRAITLMLDTHAYAAMPVIATLSTCHYYAIDVIAMPR